MERKSVVVFSILVLLLVAQEVVVKTKALRVAQTEELREAQTEELREALTEAQTEALTEALTEAKTEAQMEEQTEAVTEVGLCWRRCWCCPARICFGPQGNSRCNAFCRRKGAIRGRCRGRRCFCLFRRCPGISDVIEE